VFKKKGKGETGLHGPGSLRRGKSKPGESRGEKAKKEKDVTLSGSKKRSEKGGVVEEAEHREKKKGTIRAEQKSRGGLKRGVGGRRGETRQKKNDRAGE